MHSHGLIAALLLVAGQSRRMGTFKPLLPLRGKTLLENTADNALQGGANFLLAVTGCRGEEVSALLRRRYGENVVIVQNQEYAATDMLRSVQIGLQAMPDCDAFFLLPGDMPAVRPETFQRLLAAWDGDSPAVLFPTLDGYRKHPPLVDSRLIPAILSYDGKNGLRGFWRQHEELTRSLPVKDEGVWIDVDTPEDYRKCKEKYEEDVPCKLSAARW